MSIWPECKPYPVVGIELLPGVDEDKPPVRKEIGDWATSCPEDSIQVSLFIRAMRKFYDIPWDKKISFFRVAGIHHYPPNCTWDGASPPGYVPDKDYTDRKSYCTHNLTTFATWHRPYMLLFEQRLFELMKEVVEKMYFPYEAERQTWLEEAIQWRLPYWDWALEGTGIPFIFRHEDIWIRQPLNASQNQQPPVRVQNPLTGFVLKIDGEEAAMGDDRLGDLKILQDGNKTDGFLPWDKCIGTSRYGVKDDQYLPVNNYTMTNTAIAQHQYYNEAARNKRNNTHVDTGLVKKAISDLVYRTLVPSSQSGKTGPSPGLNFRDFCTTKYTNNTPDTWEGYLSLEMIHNNLHNMIGGSQISIGLGHMSDVPVAAFDPIFYMHHCNIDRLFAIWQTLYPDYWLEGGDDADPQNPSATAPLPPFRKTERQDPEYYSSNDVRNWRKLRYDFDVLRPRKNEQREKPKAGEESTAYNRYIRRVRAYLNRRYPHTGEAVLNAPKKALFSNDAPITFKTNEYPDYIINLLYDRYALDGAPYSIHFFLGEVDDATISSTSKLIAQDSRHIGTVFTFSGGPTDQCPNCKQQSGGDVLSSALVPLTMALLTDAEDPTVDNIWRIDEESVSAYLTANLTWKAVTMTGQIISPDRIPKTRVFVLKGKADHTDDDEVLSDFRDYVAMPEVTEGKALGASPDNYSAPADGLAV